MRQIYTYGAERAEPNLTLAGICAVKIAKKKLNKEEVYEYRKI
jgi:hypothetical protein